MCEKKKHKTIDGAEKHVASIMRSQKYSGKKLYIYHCKECDAYHITQMPQTLAKKINKKRKGIW